MHRPVPSRAHDLCEPLRIILIGLIDLHLERGSRMSRIEACDVKCATAQLMHKPQRHRASLEFDAGVVSNMPSHHPLYLFRIQSPLTAPNPSAASDTSAQKRHQGWSTSEGADQQAARRGQGYEPPPLTLENQAALQHADDVIPARAGSAIVGAVQQMRIAGGGANIEVLMLPGRADGGADELGIRLDEPVISFGMLTPSVTA